MEQYYRPVVGDDGAFDTTRFSGFVELQKPGIKQAITAGGFDVSDFARWIHEDKLFPLQKVRVLPRILRNEKAREIFLKQGARKAEAVLEKPDLNRTLLEAEIGQFARALVDKIASLPYSECQRISNDIGGDTAQALIEAQAELTELTKSLGLTHLTCPSRLLTLAWFRPSFSTPNANSGTSLTLRCARGRSTSSEGREATNT